MYCILLGLMPRGIAKSGGIVHLKSPALSFFFFFFFKKGIYLYMVAQMGNSKAKPLNHVNKKYQGT